MNALWAELARQLCAIMRDRPCSRRMGKAPMPRSDPEAPVKKMEPRPSGRETAAASRPTKNRQACSSARTPRSEASTAGNPIFWFFADIVGDEVGGSSLVVIGHRGIE